MGKYSIELLVSLSQYNSEHNVWSSIEIILSAAISTDPEVTRTIQKVLPEAKVTTVDYFSAELDNVKSAARNRPIIEAHIKNTVQKNKKVDYLILSLLQSGIAPAFPELPNVHKVLLFYDLIPLMFFKTYLSDLTNRHEWTSRLGELFRADTYLTISKTVANDLAWHTGLSHERIFNINGAPIKHGFDVAPIKVKSPFILMPTGDDLRKNNKRGIQAFAAFNKKHDNKFSLIVTSTFTDHEKAELQKLSKEVYFTGNISGEQLNYLYKECEALMFPTEYEGLGLPILEAMEWEKPILCSNISVFREISDNLFEYFDYKDVDSIEKSLHRLVENKVKPDNAAYKKVLARYTWNNTAKDTVQALSRTRPKEQKATNVTVFTPSPAQTLVGKHVQLLHGELQKIMQLRYRYESNKSKLEQRINYTAYAVPNNAMIDGRVQLKVTDGTTPLYHISDEQSCVKILFTALANPGVVVLYSSSLGTVWRCMQKNGLIHQTRLDAERKVSVQTTSGNSFLVSLVASQKAIVVHDKKLLKELKIIAKKIGKTELILNYIELPTIETVYPEALPKDRQIPRTHIIQRDTKQAEHRGTLVFDPQDGLMSSKDRSTQVTDHDLVEILANTSVFEGDGNIFLDAESIALGARVLTDPKKRDTLNALSSVELMEYSREHRSYQRLAQLINHLIQEVDHEK